jgi:2-oxoglutarate ferredoxin oxidoreductase subunit alpha
MREKIVIPEQPAAVFNRVQPECAPAQYQPYAAGPDEVPPLASFGTGYRFHVTGLTHDFRGYPTSDPEKVDYLINRLHDKINHHLDDILLWETDQMEDAEIGVLAYGSTSRSAARAVRLAREQGIRAGLIRPITIWPFPEQLVRGYAEKLQHLIVAEQNMGQLVLEVERVVAGQVPIKRVLQANGELITPDMILQAVMEVR